MTNLELQNLETRLDKVNKSITELEGVGERVYADARERMKAVLKEFITPYGDDELRISDRRIEVYPKGSNWELTSIYVKDNWGSDGTDFTDMYMSVGIFRTETMEEWVVERFQKLTYYAQAIVDFKDDILPRFNQIEEDKSKAYVAYTPEMRELRKQAKEINETISNEKERRKLEKLSNEGVEFKGRKREGWNGETYIQYPNFQAKVNERWNGIKSIKILKTSASGKSADVEVTYKGTKYNADGTQETAWVSHNVNRVRMENILEFVNYNVTVA